MSHELRKTFSVLSLDIFLLVSLHIHCTLASTGSLALQSSALHRDLPGSPAAVSPLGLWDHTQDSLYGAEDLSAVGQLEVGNEDGGGRRLQGTLNAASSERHRQTQRRLQAAAAATRDRTRASGGGGTRAGRKRRSSVGEAAGSSWDGPDKKWNKNGMRVWGKRDMVGVDDDLNTGDFNEMQESNHADVLGDLVKKWNKNGMRVWGKRSEGDNAGEREKRWNKNELRMWGKRESELGEVEKKWNKNEMRMWGKRGDYSNLESMDLEKKWNKNELRMWGKRGNELGEVEKKWNKNGMRVWGKRDNSEKLQAEKKWNKNEMRMWGKRDTALEDEGEIKNSAEIEKKWNKNEMRMWGKRNAALEDRPTNKITNKITNAAELEKKWNKNEMRMWGKRDNKDMDLEKKWNKNGMRVWGKRLSVEGQGEDFYDRDSNNLQTATDSKLVAEKKWEKNHMRMWGKRFPLDEVLSNEKRWGDKKFRMWGKRALPGGLNGVKTVDKLDQSAREDTLLQGLNKRWARNKVRMWGKRDVSSAQQRLSTSGSLPNQNLTSKFRSNFGTLHRPSEYIHSNLHGAPLSPSSNQKTSSLSRDKATPLGLSPGHVPVAETSSHGHVINSSTGSDVIIKTKNGDKQLLENVKNVKSVIPKTLKQSTDGVSKPGHSSDSKPSHDVLLTDSDNNNMNEATSTEGIYLAVADSDNEREEEEEERNSQTRQQQLTGLRDKEYRADTGSDVGGERYLADSGSSSSSLTDQHPAAPRRYARGKRSVRRAGHGGRAHGPWYLVKRAAGLHAFRYPDGGPKRSWRTNVIRVWGKRSG